MRTASPLFILSGVFCCEGLKQLADASGLHRSFASLRMTKNTNLPQTAALRRFRLELSGRRLGMGTMLLHPKSGLRFDGTGLGAAEPCLNEGSESAAGVIAAV